MGAFTFQVLADIWSFFAADAERPRVHLHDAIPAGFSCWAGINGTHNPARMCFFEAQHHYGLSSLSACVCRTGVSDCLSFMP